MALPPPGHGSPMEYTVPGPKEPKPEFVYDKEENRYAMRFSTASRV